MPMSNKSGFIAGHARRHVPDWTIGILEDYLQSRRGVAFEGKEPLPQFLLRT